MEKLIKQTLLVLVCGSLILASCSGDRIYYANKPNPTEAIKQTYGEPLYIKMRTDGSEKWVYRVPDPMATGYIERYFIIKDGKVIGGGVM